mgnify:CR=1 FL=1
MKLACVGYRPWALNIYAKLQKEFPSYNFLIQNSKQEYNEHNIVQFRPDFILFYGWSEIISVDLVKSFKCLMLHPSPLPKYRGGSPIQNQIIAGEIDSAVSIFQMDAGVDTGPIVKQEYLSLMGSLVEIFLRIESIGYKLTKEILLNGFTLQTQDHKSATEFSRLSPKMSEITLEELSKSSSLYLSNKIRMLQDPYPNPFFKTCDGKKLVFKLVEIED